MHPSIKKILFTVIALTFMLSACAPAAQPTQNPAEIQAQVQTAVALTVSAQGAQTQAAQPQVVEPTNTMLPTQTDSAPATVTPLPTLTPIVLPTKASSGGGGGGSGGGSVISLEYSCNAVNRKPFDNTIFHKGKTFDIKWTILNTGTKTMKAGLDLKFANGTKLTSTELVELPEIKPGDEYVVDFDAVAPKKAGRYTMIFVVEGGLCYPYTAIVVE